MHGICDICGADDQLETYKFTGEFDPVSLCQSCEEAEYEVYVSQWEKGLVD